MTLRTIHRWYIQCNHGFQLWKFKRNIRPNDVFLISFPKSGVTWLSYLITSIIIYPSKLELLWDEDRVSDINRLFAKKGDHRVNDLFKSLTSPRFFKIHCGYEPQLSKVVYLLRDPRAVLTSLWHYRRAKDGDFDYSLGDYIQHHRELGDTWGEHVTEWLGYQQVVHEKLLIKYEDLHYQTGIEMKKVLDFSGLSYTEDMVKNAVDATQFSRLQKLEKKIFDNLDDETLRKYRKQEDEKFFRKGKIEGWREELDQESIQTIESVYGDIMKEFGYL